MQRKIKQETKAYEGRALHDLTLHEGYLVLMDIIEGRVGRLNSLVGTPAQNEWEVFKKEGYICAIRELRSLNAEIEKRVSDWKSQQDVTKGLDKHPKKMV